MIDIRNVTTSQTLPFSELHCDKGRLSQARHKPSLWGECGRRRNWQNWEQLCRKPDVLNFLLNGKKAAHPVEARLVDFVCRLRQSLGRGLAIFQLRLGWRCTASRPTFHKFRRRHILIFFLHTCTIRERATLFLTSILPLFDELQLMLFLAAPVPGGRPQPELLSHLQQALHDRRAADGAHEVCPQGPQCLWGAR